MSKLASPEEHPGLAELPPQELHRLQHLARDVRRLVVLQGLRVQVAVGALAARQQDVVAHGERPEGLSGREACACNADCLQDATSPQLLQDIVGSQVAGLGLWIGLDAPAKPRSESMEPVWVLAVRLAGSRLTFWVQRLRLGFMHLPCYAGQGMRRSCMASGICSTAYRFYSV